MKLLGAGETKLALEQAQEILRLHPNEINSLFIMAAAQRALGEGDLALKNLKAIVARAPDYAIAQQELGFAVVLEPYKQVESSPEATSKGCVDFG